VDSPLGGTIAAVLAAPRAATSAGPTAAPGHLRKVTGHGAPPQQPQIPNPNPNLKTMSSAASTTTPPAAAHDPPVRSSPWLQPPLFSLPSLFSAVKGISRSPLWCSSARTLNRIFDCAHIHGAWPGDHFCIASARPKG
jgi:hypothetical protein